MIKKLILHFWILIFSAGTFINAQTGWQSVSSFGTNPGNLNMYSYAPTGMSSAAPLVVAMHGCTQNAVTFAAQSDWDKLADNHKFYVVYPEQKSANNSNTCFNWFQSGDQDRGQGEVLSIKQMVDYMKAHYTIDTTKIFVTGLSAGACMTSVMLACYPDVFSKGAVMAGTPFKSATNSTQAFNAMYGLVTNTPQVWGNLVTNEYPSYTGPYPKVAVFQGSSDITVYPVNETEVMKQWTNVNGADQTADVVINSFNGNSSVTKNIYNDNNGNEVVETYTITGMPHGIAVDTGSCYQQGGKIGTYALEVHLFSSFWAAYFFDILSNSPFTITGLQTVFTNQNNVTYSVPNTANTYTWTVPSGDNIVSGQGTNQIIVNFGSQSGYITVEETQTAGNCLEGPVKLYVTVSGNTGTFSTSADTEFQVYPNPATEILTIQIGSYARELQLEIYNMQGEKVYSLMLASSDNQINIKKLPKGIYALHLYNDGYNYTGKILKQ